MYGCGFAKCCYSNPDAVQAMVYTGDNDQQLAENEYRMFNQTQETIIGLGALSQLPQDDQMKKKVKQKSQGCDPVQHKSPGTNIPPS
jgi:hypothetical protein